jgi:DNA topoisomerase-1
MDLVVVESPAKAKTIDKYLGPGFRVLASYGHVRDLPEKEGSVDPEHDFQMTYELIAEKRKRVEEIALAMKDAERLWLATDPDREGEAISWHLRAALEAKRALKGKPVERVVFHEVTKPAVLEAMKHPRRLDDNLIDAYQARRALDYLVGFELSPVLWRKLPGSRSAGRVQSVALRLICEREAEIEAFKAQEYWSVEALLRTTAGASFTARLTQLDGRKLDRFALANEQAAHAAVEAVGAARLSVGSVEKKQVQRTPAPPFSTSTLQQEAARKLGFSAKRTMDAAQRLFEGVNLGGETVGLITYMRTDSVALSSEALGAARRLIKSRFGDRYLPEKPRVYKTKAKNAQEAHEAIRPTDMFRNPDQLPQHLEADQRRLYELIWQRTVASQMAAALLDRVIVDIVDAGGKVGLRATGQTVAFDGFLKLYQEGRDDPTHDEEDEEGRILPPLAVGDAARAEKVTPHQHFTEPPPRFSEASLVKKLEELGIGRPSTYASIISVLQDRGYVRLEQKRFMPEDKGRLVTAFLVSYFDQWMQPGFTAALEDKLDDVAGGEIDWKEVLREWWPPFKGRIDEALSLQRAAVLTALDEALAPKLYPADGNGTNPRQCPLCGAGTLSLKLSKFGPFIGCSNYPECRYTRPFGVEGNGSTGDRVLGEDAGQEVVLKAGRFGPYVQRGTGDDAKRVSLPSGVGPETLDLETALRLLALPREVCRHPETGEPVLVGIGRYGPYIQQGKRYVNLPRDEDVLSIGANRVLDLLASDRGRAQRPSTEPLRDLGPHPEDGEPVVVLAGRFGPYVKHGKINASLRKDTTPESLTMEEALGLLAGKAEKPGRGRGSAKGRKAAAKPVVKQAGAKPAARKAASRKKPAAGDKAGSKSAAPRRAARR